MADEENKDILTTDIVVNGAVMELQLGQIAEIEFEQFEAKKKSFANVPEGMMEWRVSATDYNVRAVNDPQNPNGPKVPRLVIVIQSEVEAVQHLKDVNVDPNTCIGMKHNETFFIKDLREDMENVQYYLMKMGVQGKAKIREHLQSIVGARYAGMAKHRADRNDKSRIYCNIDPDTCSPLGQQTMGIATGGMPAFDPAMAVSGVQQNTAPAAPAFAIPPNGAGGQVVAAGGFTLPGRTQ